MTLPTDRIAEIAALLEGQRDERYVSFFTGDGPTYRHVPIGNVAEIRALVAEITELRALTHGAHADTARMVDAEQEKDVLFEERRRLRELASFFASVIRSGEAWSPTCDAMYSKAFAPWHEMEVDLAATRSTPEGNQR